LALRMPSSSATVKTVSGGIFLRRGDELIAMTEQAYPAESVLQELIAAHPTLLSADGSAHRWLLISREVGVASEAGGGDRWSLDHLFLDERGTPTLVEVKRSTDTRIRREVVGQMLDYAANAVTYWSLADVRARFASECERRGESEEEVIAGALGPDVDPDELWRQVETNLAAGSLRLVFVADVIPSELRAIVEFLNTQMTTTEVLAVEVRQYVADDGAHQTLVPRLIGQTEAARQAKSAPPRRHVTAELWLQELRERRGGGVAEAAEEVFAWAKNRSPPVTVQFGSGAKDVSAQFGVRPPHGYIFPFFMYWGYLTSFVAIQFGTMISAPYHPFDRADMRRELQRRLNAIEGVSIPDDRIDKFPSFDLEILEDSDARRLFIEVMDWVIGEASAASRG
jgi:hypothetical protein